MKLVDVIKQGIFIVIPSIEGWPTKTKEAPSLHEVRLTLLATNPVFQCLGELTNVALETLLNKLFTLDRESNKHNKRTYKTKTISFQFHLI